MDTISFEWNSEKNRLLQEERNISFEEIVLALENDKLLGIIESPTHQGQYCFIVEISSYAYAVPYVQADAYTYFLKTIYPSRKYTKLFLKERP